MAGNKTLGKAKMQKKDEFYTQLSDIENELRHYKKHFKGKTVFCNCDDPYESNFFKYFAMNFNSLGLKKLIATCYASSPVTGKEFRYFVGKDEQLSFFPSADSAPPQEKSSRKPYKVEITEVKDLNGDGRVDLADVEYLMRSKKNTMTLLKGNGDFRSDECVELLKEADIVVTNPPFSLFREYMAQLIEYKKDFIIIGNQNALHYKEIFPLIQENKMWLGYGFSRGNAYFKVPADSDANQYAKGVYDTTTGLVKFRNCVWFTNLDIEKRHEELILYKKYTPEDYPCYYNYDAIDVSKVSDIPCDYWGEMGVPDNFLDSYNPNQFEIIGMASDVPKTMIHKVVGNEIQYIQGDRVLWSTPYTVAERKAGNSLRISDKGLPAKLPYSRIIIRRKQVSADEN